MDQLAKKLEASEFFRIGCTPILELVRKVVCEYEGDGRKKKENIMR